MTVKELITILQKHDPDKRVTAARFDLLSGEEWGVEPKLENLGTEIRIY